MEKSVLDNFKDDRHLNRFFAFILITITSAFFSLNIFTRLGSMWWEKLFLALGSGGIEFFKALLTIDIGYAILCTAYYFRRRKIDLRFKGLFFLYLKRMTMCIVLYIFTLAISVSGSLGFGLTTVYKYSQSTTIRDTSKDIAVEDITVKLLQQDILLLEDDKTLLLKEVENLRAEIVNLEKNIETVRELDSNLNKTTADGRWTSNNVYIPRINQGLASIRETNEKISLLNKELQNKNVEIQNKNREILFSENRKVEVDRDRIEEETQFEKSMFELIAEAVSTENKPVKPTTIMFLFIIIFAIGIEICQLYTSPHKTIVDEIGDLELYNFKLKQKFKKRINKPVLTKEKKPEEEEIIESESFLVEAMKQVIQEEEKKAIEPIETIRHLNEELELDLAKKKALTKFMDTDKIKTKKIDNKKINDLLEEV